MRRLLPQVLWMALCTISLCSYSNASILSHSRADVEGMLFQAQTITGKVLDETGTGMPGVNVIVKGTSNGTTTDAEGIYRLDLSNDQAAGTLVFSFIGYAVQEQPINNRTTINVSMRADVSELSLSDTERRKSAT